MADDNNTCSLPDCGNLLLARGWCGTHYRRWQRTGSLDIAPTFPKPLCLVSGCGVGAEVKNYCARHYARFIKTGAAGAPTFRMAKRPVVDGRKQCGACAQSKPLSDFNKHPLGTGGVGANCRLCLSAKSREWFSKNPTYRAEWNAANAESKLADVHRRRARRLDVDADLIDRGTVFARDGNACQLCGDPMEMAQKTPRPLAPTLDHILALSKGGTHTLANVQSAHFHCNVSKGNRSAPLTRPHSA